MSRNQREGRYYGWAKRHHIRTHEHRRVDSWRAYRIYVERSYRKGAKDND